MSRWILEIKDGSYADHEYVGDEWHRIELTLNNAKMEKLIRCKDCKYSCISSHFVECEKLDICLPRDEFNRFFCAWAKPKEGAE